MSKGEFAPAIGEQFVNVWNRGLSYKGKDGKTYDLKFFTPNSHFQLNVALQCCYYRINGKDDCNVNTSPLMLDRNYTKNHYRNKIGWPDDKLLVGDSAGFQLASFKRSDKVCDIQPIDSLRWQEANVDIVMNLDVPSTFLKVAEYDFFKYALKTSIENFTFFEKNRQNYKAKFYNVLHGETLPLMEEWYNGVKHFTSFNGWAVGMKPPYDPMIQAMGILFLLEKGELQNDKCFGLHFFGTSGKHVVPTIIYIASKLHGLRVTYDSSSYNIGSIYRTYFMPFDIGPHLSFGDKFNRVNPHLKELPCQCPVCSSIHSINDLNGNDIYAGALISLHNLYQYHYYNELLNKLVEDKDLFLRYLNSINISSKTLQRIKFIDYALEKGFYNAVDMFKNDLIPQHIEKTKQGGIFDFG